MWDSGLDGHSRPEAQAVVRDHGTVTDAVQRPGTQHDVYSRTPHAGNTPTLPRVQLMKHLHWHQHSPQTYPITRAELDFRLLFQRHYFCIVSIIPR